jgi:hypothetical protein
MSLLERNVDMTEAFERNNGILSQTVFFEGEKMTINDYRDLAEFNKMVYERNLKLMKDSGRDSFKGCLGTVIKTNRTYWYKIGESVYGKETFRDNTCVSNGEGGFEMCDVWITGWRDNDEKASSEA